MAIMALLYLFYYYYSANSTLLSLLRFSYFVTPNDAQASSACSPLIYIFDFLKVILVLKYYVMGCHYDLSKEPNLSPVS